jgi:hypothetical protein
MIKGKENFMNQTCIKAIKVGNRTVELISSPGKRLAELEQKTHLVLWTLVQDLTELSSITYIKEFAEISNFFWKGWQFQCIESIEAFQVNYRTQIELERRHAGDIFPYRLTDYQIFDVSHMHEPRIENDNLIYFVWNTENGLPYRVVCPFPYVATSNIVHYQILPIAKEL